MRFKKIVVAFTFPAVIFFISQFIFGPLDLYVEIWWLDIPMHLIGGIAVAFTAHLLLSEFEREGKFRATRLLRALFMIFFVAFIEVAWEWYEFLQTFVLHAAPQTWPDTLKDLFVGISGAVIACAFLKKKAQ